MLLHCLEILAINEFQAGKVRPRTLSQISLLGMTMSISKGSMFKKGEIIELEIEKLVYGGEGIGKFNDFIVFVANSVPGDRVKAEIISVKKGYAKGILKEIIKPSEYRVTPFCPLAKVCGGCQWQHIDYEKQLEAKRNIVEETLKRIAGIETTVKNTLPCDETRNYRCKIQFPVQQTKISKKFLVGYYKKNTHEIVNIKYCPVQPRIIDDVTEFLREKVHQLHLSAYNEKAQKGLIRHFVFRYSKTNLNFILTIVVNSEQIPENLMKLCKITKEKFPQLEGVAVNFNTTRTNLIMGTKSRIIEGKSYVTEILDGKTFKISHDAFFQVNPSAALKMFSEVRKIVAERTNSPDILDIYAGSGGFSIFLSGIADKITAVESAKSSVEDGMRNIAKNNITNITYINDNANIAVPKLLAEGRKFDVTILDPPKKGCSEEVLNAVKEITGKYIVYVSCNPATLARDMKILSDKFRVNFVQPVDMFCHTYHVESILLAEAVK